MADVPHSEFRVPHSGPGRVYLVGAGPGDVGLLTLRAVECLQQADFVLYDYLAPPRALDFARPEAERFRVTNFAGNHAARWPHVVAKVLEEARKGKVVVHLKGGDPSVFGRAAEEAEALRTAGIPYEIVPGVTAAFAAAAFAEIPLTHRARSSAIALVTGHEDPGKGESTLDWDALAHFPGTLAVYMGVTQLGHIAHELLGRGTSSDTPAALVYKASTGEQRTITAGLGDLEERVREAGVGRPSLLLIGPAVALKPERSWFEARPLAGMRVLVTRPRAQALPFVRKLELLGAVPVLLPVIEAREPADWGPVDAAIDRLGAGGYDWLVFTSANGVMAFFNRLKALGRDARRIGRAQLAAIGPATAAALGEYQLIPEVVPTADLRSEGLADLLTERCRGGRVLVAQAVQGRGLLRERLSTVATVDVAPIYEQATAVDPNSDAFDRLRRGEIDVITMTSPNVAKAFLAACDETLLQRLRGERAVYMLVNSERLADMLSGSYPVLNAGPTTDSLIQALIHMPRTTWGGEHR